MAGAVSARITLDDLLAFNEELKAVARCGIPLDRGLRIMAGDARGRRGQLLQNVSESLARGDDVAQALRPSTTGIPPYYAAVVTAGIRSGRLPVALESIATCGRRLAQAQRSARLILWYPLIVATLAYGCFLAALLQVTPRILSLLDVPSRPPSRWVGYVTWLSENVLLWAWIPPLAIIALGLLAWWYLSRAPHQSGNGPRSLGSLGRLKSVNGMITFTELLALLCEHDVPLPEALPLAASATNQRRTIAAAQEWSAAIARGATADAKKLGRYFPNRLLWAIDSATSKDQLVASLRHLAERYHRESQGLADWLSLYLPIFLTIAIGGTAVLLYALLLFLPWCFALWHLGGAAFGTI
jgi:general secretion pathway protein F